MLNNCLTFIVAFKSPNISSIFLSQIEFQICESKKNNTKTAVNVQLTGPQLNNPRPTLGAKQQGFIATLKENFGFIETAEHDKEVFFHFR